MRSDGRTDPRIGRREPRIGRTKPRIGRREPRINTNKHEYFRALIRDDSCAFVVNISRALMHANSCAFVAERRAVA